MTAVDWEEVKRLAADFQRAQLTSTSQTLSERNCVEIITKLIELNLLDVVFTTDGKEYITPQYLIKEIKDELYVSGGRINLVELAHSLNVDLSHVSAKAAEVERSVPGCTIIMGQLIDRQYINTISLEINEKLQTKGQVTISELTRLYDLPSDFLQNVVEKNLGKTIQAKQDKSDARLFYTEAFVIHNNAVVRGALTAITQPTQVSAILQICDFEEREFYAAFENLIEEKNIAGVLTAKQGGNSLYIPYVYTKKQNEWVDNFYKQNGYLEYDALVRLGITEPVTFVRRHFPQSGGFVELASCAIGPQLINQLQNAIEETLISGSYLDLSMMLPSVFSTEDVAKVSEVAFKRCKSKVVVHTFCDTVLVTKRFLDEMTKPLDPLIKTKGKEAVENGSYMQAIVERKLAKGGGQAEQEDSKAEKREERRKKAAGGKVGGGTQGRETKTKSLKNKKDRRGKGDLFDDSDDEYESKGKKSSGGGGGGDKNNLGKLELFTVEEIEKVLKKEGSLADEDESLISAISEHLFPSVNRRAEEAAAEEYERRLQTSVGSRRKLHSDLQAKLDLTLMEIRLYERGLKLLGGDTQSNLTTHLIKTICTELVNSIFNYVGQELCSRPGTEPKDMTPDLRTKILAEVPSDCKEPLTRLHKSLTANSIEEFFLAVESAVTVSGLVIRKQDKKKEKSFLHSHREKLLGELGQTEDPTQVLYLAMVILFQVAHQNIIHASGKFVPALLAYLKPNMTPSDFTSLQNYQELVLKLLTHTDDPEAQSQIKGELNENLNAVRDIAMNYRKPPTEKS